MGLRFRRSVTIFPGVRLNFGAGGVSLSFGRRGASVTVGERGTYASVGLPGTGLSYRTRVDIPGPPRSSAPLYTEDLQRPFRESPAPRPAPTLEAALRGILADRERGAINWQDRALWLADPAPPEEDEEAFERHARRIAAGRFARRMVEGDRAAWSEVIREELINEELPFDIAFEWGIEAEPERVYLGVVLPPKEAVTVLGLPAMKERELYEDVACGLLLRMAHEILRIIPEADTLYLIGFMDGRDPSSGLPARETYLRLATDRDSFSELVLDQVDPSSAFERLGGVSAKRRGELVPISLEEQ